MSDRQIQPAQPIRERDIALARPPRSRGLISQVTVVMLQPRQFFRSMPLMADTRQWFVVAFLILVLVGWSEVRYETYQTGTTTDLTSQLGLSDSSISSGTPGGGIDFGGIPSDSSANSSSPTLDGTSSDITETLITALIAASHIILGWIILSILLCEVSLFNGKSPNLGLNMQIAIWSTVPIGVMAGIQLIYYASGGKPGAIGLSGLLVLWKDYPTLSAFARSALLSLISRTTVFWLWSLFLLYIGARMSLQGKWWASVLVVIGWIVILVILPVITGTVVAPNPTEDAMNAQIVPTLQQLPDISTDSSSP